MAKIINFHEIKDPKWFEDTLEVICSRYQIVPWSGIRNFYSGKSTTRNIAHITIDDGHISTYTIIYPILKKLGLQASIFISPKITLEHTNFWFTELKDYDQEKLKNAIATILKIPEAQLDGLYLNSIFKTITVEQVWEIIHLYQNQYHVPAKTAEFINETQLWELEQSGIFEIGAHSLTHPILANEESGDSKREIVDSVNQLSELLNRKVTTFAYPNGSPGMDFGSREKQFLTEAGIKYALSFEFRDLRKHDDLLSIPRYGLRHGSKDFIAKKLKYGALWEPFKKIVFNNEDKHRKKISKIIFGR